MLKQLFTFLLLLFVFKNTFICNIQASESPVVFEKRSLENTKKYTLSICTTFSNEARFLKEWITYHLIFGIDHFYLYNMGSNDSYQNILRPYINEGVITLVNWPVPDKKEQSHSYEWALNIQIPAYENAVNFLAREETKWLVFIDVNEYLVCPNTFITELLKDYDDYVGLSLSSDVFDRYKKITFPVTQFEDSSGSMNTFKSLFPDHSGSKMIFKPDQCIGFIWPPYQCRFKARETVKKMNRHELRILHHINRNRDYLTLDGRSLYKEEYSDFPQTEVDPGERFNGKLMTEFPHQSIYEVAPQFLKKLKQEASQNELKD